MSSFRTYAIFCLFIHGSSTMMCNIFAETFHLDVQYTKLPLFQTEMLSYNGSLKQNFYLVVYIFLSDRIYFALVSLLTSPQDVQHTHLRS